MKPHYAVVVLGAAVVVGVLVVSRTAHHDPPNPQLAPKPAVTAPPEAGKAIEPGEGERAATSSTSTAGKVWISKNGTFDVTVWTAACDARGSCDEKKRAAARVVVKDRHGEVTRPEASPEIPLRLDLPVGEYELVALGPGKSQSEPAKVKIEEGKTGEVELLIKLRK